MEVQIYTEIDNKYRLIKNIGKGATAKVWKGQNKIKAPTEDVKTYAIKVFEINNGRNIDDVIENFRNQVTNLKSLFCDQVIQILDYNEESILLHPDNTEEVQPTIVMKYADGGHFWQYLGEEFPEKFARYYFHQLIDCISAIHSKGYAHFDIKPDNLLIDNKNHIVFGDVGYTQKFKDSNGNTRLFRTKTGTMHFQAPQIYNFRQAYSAPPTDIFSAGLILFMMMFGGKLPFSRTFESLKKLQTWLYLEDKSKYWNVWAPSYPNIPEKFKKLINGLLEQDPSKRFTIEDIRKNEWYNGELPDEKEIAEFLPQILKQKPDEFQVDKGKDEKDGERSDVNFAFQLEDKLYQSSMLQQTGVLNVNRTPETIQEKDIKNTDILIKMDQKRLFQIICLIHDRFGAQIDVDESNYKIKYYFKNNRQQENDEQNEQNEKAESVIEKEVVTFSKENKSFDLVVELEILQNLDFSVLRITQLQGEIFEKFNFQYIIKTYLQQIQVVDLSDL